MPMALAATESSRHAGCASLPAPPINASSRLPRWHSWRTLPERKDQEAGFGNLTHQAEIRPDGKAEAVLGLMSVPALAVAWNSHRRRRIPSMLARKAPMHREIQEQHGSTDLLPLSL